jgi:hypothetical protein
VIHHFFAISALNIDAVEKVSTVHVIPLNTLASFIEGCNSGSEQACDDSSNQKIHNCASGLLDSADVPWIADEHSRERPKQEGEDQEGFGNGYWPHHASLNTRDSRSIAAVAARNASASPG